MVIWTVSTSINVKRARSADALTAVMIERDRTAALAATLHGYRVGTLADQLLIEDIKHLKERRVFLDAGNMISLEMTFCLGVLLTPYL